MKLSISLPEDDVGFLDAYAEARGIGSRSAVLHKAVQLLRASELGPVYEEAWEEWWAGGEEAAWSVTSADGLA